MNVARSPHSFSFAFSALFMGAFDGCLFPRSVWMVFVHVWEKHILPQFERNFWLCKFAFWIYRVVICHLSIVICHFLVLRVSQCLFLDTWNSLLISFANFLVCGFSIALHTAIFPQFFFFFLNSFFFLLKFLRIFFLASSLSDTGVWVIFVSE